MLRRADTREILVLRRNGTWSLHRDSWREGDSLSDVGAAPAGKIAPERGFGKLWRQQPDLRLTLGWATGVEESLRGSAQEFAGGHMLGADYRLIYVLYQDGSWQSFADTVSE